MLIGSPESPPVPAQSDRLSLAGQVASGAGHEYNNLLLALRLNLEALDNFIAADSGGRPVYEAALAAAENAVAFTRRLLLVGARSPRAPIVLDVGALIAALAPRLAKNGDASVTVELALDPTAPRIIGDPELLTQVLIGIARNAWAAMPNGGTLVVATEFLPANLPAPRFVMVALTDQGIGMAPDRARQALEPFFSGWEAREGPGLGLSEAYGFARQSGGGLEIESQPGVGTSVKLFLPVAAASNTAAERTRD